MNRASHGLIEIAPAVALPLEPSELSFLERARTHLDPIVHALIHAGISADTVTGLSRQRARGARTLRRGSAGHRNRVDR
jgi:hypothetical protein